MNGVYYRPRLTRPVIARYKALRNIEAPTPALNISFDIHQDDAVAQRVNFSTTVGIMLSHACWDCCDKGKDKSKGEGIVHFGWWRSSVVEGEWGLVGPCGNSQESHPTLTTPTEPREPTEPTNASFADTFSYANTFLYTERIDLCRHGAISYAQADDIPTTPSALVISSHPPPYIHLSHCIGRAHHSLSIGH